MPRDAADRLAPIEIGAQPEVEIERLVAGGDGLGRLSDGRVVFIPAVVSGELVQIEVVSARKDLARGRVIEIKRPSAHRTTAPCDRVAAGCGGCSWQHIELDAQHDEKVNVVRDAFRRIGRVIDVDTMVTKGGSVVAPGTSSGWRTTVRAAIDAAGRAGFRVAGTHDVCVSGPCLVAHPVISRVLADGRFPGCTEVQIRVGIHGASAVVVVDGKTKRVEVPDITMIEGFADWKPIEVYSWDELNVGQPGAVFERIGGVDFRVSAPSFFQSGPAAAELLVATVTEALRAYGRADVFVDLYSGVGLFAATVGREALARVLIESSVSSVNDAEYNLPGDALVHRKDVTEWEPPRLVRRSQKTHLVADPARDGLGARGVEAVLRAEPDVVVLVSCDAAAGARDVAMFAEAGWVLKSATVLEVFPHTAHVEVVSVLEPGR